MNRLEFETSDMVSQNIEKIAELFPAAITEMRDENGNLKKGINFETLKQLLSPDVADGEERYEFTWVGKKAAMAEAARPITKTLRPVKEDSRDWDTTENLYIEGDNLEVLKILQESYLGKVKLIYIDPPYNTGEDFIYRDDFKRKTIVENYNSGIFDEEMNFLWKNTNNEGRFHSVWCSNVYSRLLVARDFLSDDGVVFISIDNHEIANLMKICSEIFMEKNFVGCIVIQTATDNNPGQIKNEHEYILCYAKNKDNLEYWQAESQKAKLILNKYLSLKERYEDSIDKIQIELRNWIKKNKEDLKGFSHYDNVDKQGVFHDGDIANTVFGGYRYEIIHPITGKPCRIPEKGFRFPESTMREMIQSDNILFGENESILIKPKKRIEDANDVLRSVIYEDGRSSTKRFESLLSRDVFQNPKSPNIIERLISFVVKPGDIILDFFSGSATTAEAVMNLNSKKTNLNLKYILVQIPEDLDIKISQVSGRAKQTINNSIKFLDSINKAHTICEIGKERIRRAGDKIKSEHPDADLDIGFRVFRVDESNMKDVYYHPEEMTQQDLFAQVSNIKEDRTDMDLLYACLLDWGVEIHLPHTQEVVEGCTVHDVDSGALMACFDEKVPVAVVEYMAKKQPLRVVFRDSAFASDAEKINVTEIFKNLSPDTKVKVL